MFLSIYKLFQTFGINLHRLLFSVLSLPSFFFDLLSFRKQLRKNSCKIKISLSPCLYERHQNAGTARGHYFHQDLFVASNIFKAGPKRHVDVGSRIDGFVAHVASFREVEVLDIRPMMEKTHSITFLQADLMQPLASKYHAYCDSLSCLPVIYP